MKKLCIILAAAAVILLLAGCHGPAPVETMPQETTAATEPTVIPETGPQETAVSTEPTAIPETEPADPIFPLFEDENWSLVNEDYELYQYTGDMDKIQLVGYSLSIPEEWQDKVTVLRSEPASWDDRVYITGNGLNAAYAKMAEDGIYSNVGFSDYLIIIGKALKSEAGMDSAFINQWGYKVEEGKAVKVGEDAEYAYFVGVHDTMDGHGLFTREELVNEIGQEAYDELLQGLHCTLEEAAAMITVG